jgi:phosphate-selective porin OprO/OprP
MRKNLKPWVWAIATAAAIAPLWQSAAQEPYQGAGNVEAVSGPSVRTGEFYRPDGQPLTADEVRFIVNESLAEQEKKKAAEDKNKPYIVGSDNKLTASYNNGFWVESAKKDFRMRIGGRTQMDTVWLDGDTSFETGLAPAAGTNYALQDAWGFRRARLSIEGTVHQTMEWAVEYDFVNSINDNPGTGGAAATNGPLNVVNVPAPTDLWWQFSHVPAFGAVRIGNQKEPIGLEHLSSSRFLDFMERSFLQDAYTGQFNNGFTPGILMYDWAQNETATWQWGVFKTTQNVFASQAYDGGYAFTGRFSINPYYDEPTNGRYLVHFGSSVSWRDASQIGAGAPEQFRIRTRASLRNGLSQNWPNIADTGVFFADNQTMWNFEAAVQNGPLKIQAEYLASFHDDTMTNAGSFVAGGSANAYPTQGAFIGSYFTQGAYVEALYFLTGEHLQYDRQGGTFGRVGVAPYENAFAVSNPGGCNHRGSGAWQVGLRYNALDLNDPGLNGGIVQDFTAGLNWFWNPRSKVQWNYVYTRRDAPVTGANSNMTGAGVRLAWDY